jgi:hypothetical protein
MNALTMKRMMRAGLLALTMGTVAACGGSGHKSGSDGGTPGDMAGTTNPSPDMSPPPCVMDPKSGNDFLNACTTAQTGDPAKDYPYYPKLAPNGNLPPIN